MQKTQQIRHNMIKASSEYSTDITPFDLSILYENTTIENTNMIKLFLASFQNFSNFDLSSIL